MTTTCTTQGIASELSSHRLILGAPPVRLTLCRWLALAAVTLGIATSAWSQVAILSIPDYSPAQATIHLSGETGQRWMIEYTPSLQNLTWTSLGIIDLTETNSGIFRDTTVATAAQRYYRGHLSEAGFGPNQVYSANLVGYMNVQVLPQNFALLANTFVGTNQEIASVLPTVPDGVMLWKPAPGGASWELNWFAHGLGWGTPTMRLPSGEGFWIYNPGTDPFFLTFKGEVPMGLTTQIPMGVKLCSFEGPVSWEFLNGEGEVFKYNPATRSWERYEFDPGFGEWVPMEPSLQPGEAFYLYTTSPLYSWMGIRPRAVSVSAPPGVTVTTISPDPAIGRVRDSYRNERLLSGCAFQAQFFVKTNISDSDLFPASSPQCFLEGEWAGCIRPWLFSGYADPAVEQIMFQVRAWDAAGGTNYYMARQNYAPTGTAQFYLARTPRPYTVIDGPIIVPIFPNFSLSTPGPWISQQPASQIVSIGSDVHFSVEAIGDGAQYYQWQFDGTNIPGANSTVLTISNAYCVNRGSYTVLVTNSVGQLVSMPATLSLTQLLKTPGTPAALGICGPVGTQYRVDWADVLATNTWQVLSNFTLTSNPVLIVDPDSKNAQNRFYRTVKLSETGR